MCQRRQLLLTACLLVWMAAECAHAQGTVGEAMLMQVLNNAGNLLNAGGNLVTTLVQPATTADVELPRCPKSHVLRSVPDDWASLTAEEQAAHPINLPVMQLAYSVYQPPKTFATCLKGMGIDSILPVTVPVPDFPLTSATAHVYKAGNSSVWVVFKGSDVSNLLQNLECGHTPPVGGRFGARSADVRLHSGFYAGWQALEAPVTAAVLEFLQEVPTGKVYVVGHSLGAALASIAALRLSRTLPAPAEVAGVWLLAAPRAGNPTWKQIYNAVLLKKTLRISNFLDIAAGLPKPLEACGEAAEGGIILRVAPYNN